LPILSSYISRLHTPFSIAYNSGIHHCKSMEQSGTRIIIDYWQDEWGVDWKIKGYTNGHFLALLYVQNINDGDVEKQEAFLSGME
jgi:hypothetical protein